jgi:signal peptidase II
VSLHLRRPPAIALALIAGILILDQVTKAFVVANIDRLPADVIGGIRLEFVRNTGVSFSLFQGRGWLVTLLVCLVVAVVLVLFLTMPRRYSIPLAVLLGGSLANLVDRFRYGYVVDFVALWWWPRFNVADLAIILGASLTVLTVVFHPGLRSDEIPDPGEEMGAAAGAQEGTRDADLDHVPQTGGGRSAGRPTPDGTPDAHDEPDKAPAAVIPESTDAPAGESGEEGGRPESPAGRPEDR